MIDRYLLRYFLAVIDCGSFSKAARQVNVAQPTLSVGIGKLESLLGTSLFQRSSKRVHLTDAGSRFATHARRIENEFQIAEAEILDKEPVRTLRLGVISTFPMALLGESIRAARHAGESTRLQIVGGNERELLQRISRGQIEAALTIVRPDSDRFASERLFTEGYAMALHSGHALAEKKSVTAEELSETPGIIRRHCEVVSETSRHFTERGVRPLFAFRGTNDEQVLTLVQAGLGGAVMPMCYAMRGVVRPLLSGFDLKRTIGLLYATHAEHLQHGGSAALEAIRAKLARK
ncbi:MAG: LysR family transcriptional regulator [Acidobacteriota bacterium]|nr:LysR family transcriptional regulator [Acidobacteriota bacterium]